MRLDMPILNDEFVGSDKEDDAVLQEDEPLPQARTAQEMEDEWDELIREAEESQASQSPPRPSPNTPGPSHATPGPSHDTPRPSQNTPGLRYDTPGPSDLINESQSSTPAPLKTNTDSPFTPDQLERMERNKHMAREKRLAKLGIRSPATPSLSRPTPGNSQASQRGSDFQALQSQSSQQGQIRVPSPEKQTGSQTIEQEISDAQSAEDSVNREAAAVTESQTDALDEEMSEVIKTQNDRVVLQRHQDAQNWCTEPSVSQTGKNQGDSEPVDSCSVVTASESRTNSQDNLSETDDLRHKSKATEESSLKRTKEGVELTKNGEANDSNFDERMDSEEMSEVIPQQNDGKVPITAESHTENTESMEEMSEIIEKQDHKKLSSENDKENVLGIMNGISEVDETGDLKHKDKAGVGKGKVLNIVNSDFNATGEKKEIIVNGTDELNEDELMDTLES